MSIDTHHDETKLLAFMSGRKHASPDLGIEATTDFILATTWHSMRLCTSLGLDEDLSLFLNTKSITLVHLSQSSICHNYWIPVYFCRTSTYVCPLNRRVMSNHNTPHHKWCCVFCIRLSIGRLPGRNCTIKQYRTPLHVDFGIRVAALRAKMFLNIYIVMTQNPSAIKT